MSVIIPFPVRPRPRPRSRRWLWAVAGLSAAILASSGVYMAGRDLLRAAQVAAVVSPDPAAGT